jgi:hypothetical protein
LTAITNTTALVKPATARKPSHPIALDANGIAASVATNTTNDARSAIADRVNRPDAVPAKAPARYPT